MGMFKTLRRYKKPIFLTVGVLTILGYIGTKTPAVRDPAAKFLDEQSANLARKISPQNAENIHEFLIHPGDWFGTGWDTLMHANWNPWKREKGEIGSHYEKLRHSKDPADQKKLAEIYKLSEEWYQRLLERYPDMAVTYKDVPDERNGFLKFYDFANRFEFRSSTLGLPQELLYYFNSHKQWNPEMAKAYLEKNRAFVDELRSIALLEEQSVKGIDPQYLGFYSVSFLLECSHILEMDARLAAERGDQAAAMESMLVIYRLANHFDQIETPSLLHATGSISLRSRAQEAIFSRILPALPAGSRDLSAWEKMANLNPEPLASYGRIMKGEWHISMRSYALPILSDPEEQSRPSDPDAFIDSQTSFMREIIDANQSTHFKDLALPAPDIHPNSIGLSRKSRKYNEVFTIGSSFWRTGFERKQHTAAMGQAAFAILKGQPVPNDPVYGLPYRWDPSTRKLRAPKSPAFDKMQLSPVTLPK